MQAALRMGKIGFPTKPVFSTSYGRRALLHANAILQMASAMPVANPKMASMYLPICMYHAASLFLDYIAYMTSSTDFQGPVVDLTEQTNWRELASSGLDLHGGSVTSVDTHCLFVEHGGIPCILNNAMSVFDIQPLISSLSAFGTVWPRSRTMAEELGRAMM